MLVEIKRITPAFKDGRGTITDLIVGEKIQHAGIITSKANALRGSHYHKLSTQYNYVLSGKLELIVKDARNQSSEKERIVLESGDFVKIPPMVIHALNAMEESTFLVFTSEARIGDDYENDTFRVTV